MDEPSSWNIKLTQAGGKLVLTLNGATITGTPQTDCNAGIFYNGDKPLQIRLIGDNTVNAGVPQQEYSNIVAICISDYERNGNYADLEITSDKPDVSGKLTISSEMAPAGSADSSWGFDSGGNVTISGSAIVTAAGGPVRQSTGFHSGPLTMRGSARLTAESSSEANAGSAVSIGNLTMSENAVLEALVPGNSVNITGLFVWGGASVSGNAQVTKPSMLNGSPTIQARR